MQRLISLVARGRASARRASLRSLRHPWLRSLLAARFAILAPARCSSRSARRADVRPLQRRWLVALFAAVTLFPTIEDAVAATEARRSMLQAHAAVAAAVDSLLDPREVHLRNLRQLTFGGENAEAYFSFDGKKLVFQSTRDSYPCDQIYTMNVDGSDLRRVSNGTGRTTCSYWLPGERQQVGDISVRVARIVYASTHLASPECPPKPDYSKGYVWPLYPTYDIFSARADGKDVHRITYARGYDAEAVVSPDGKHIVFTSTRSGDPEIYVMRTDGSYLHRLTNAKGYDGGPWWSPDGQWIAYRAYHPETKAEVADFDSLMKLDLIRPTTLELWVMRADGTEQHQVTKLGAASFCPTWITTKRLLFASNVDDPKGRNFDLYAINVDGTGLEQITYNETFDAFPMMSPDGTKIVWCSNRATPVTHETNVFIADWVDTPAESKASETPSH